MDSAMNELVIADLTLSHVDGCRAVIESLPEWFGYEGALEGVSEATATARGFVALEADEVIGFVTTDPLFEETLEITYLAVGARSRGKGVGRHLVAAVCVAAMELGASSIVLLTLGPTSGSTHYAETVAFYRAIGFWRTKELYLSSWGGAPTLVLSGPVIEIAERC
jgi:N-acetylglutamate synthase-like GNAT family acetyltransferase